MRTTAHIAFCAALLAALALTPAAAAAAADEPLYNNSSSDPGSADWTAGHEGPTAENVTHYVSTLGTFVVGEHPSDPAAGPILTGVLVGVVAVGTLGTTRSGLVAGGVMAVAASAVLTQSAGLAPRWLYGVVVMMLALVASGVYIRMLR